MDSSQIYHTYNITSNIFSNNFNNLTFMGPRIVIIF